MGTIWDKRKAVQRMQEYIETHLEHPIYMSELARAAAWSVYHAARVFKEITGLSPFEYIRKRRLTAAAMRLDKFPSRVIDVAFDFTFHSHEGFTRAFTRQFGVPPSQLQNINWSAYAYFPEYATEHYIRRQKGQCKMNSNSDNHPTENLKSKEVVFVQILERPKRKFIFKPGKKAAHYFEYCEEAGCDVWNILTQVAPALNEPLGVWWPDEIRPKDCSAYVMGVEVDAHFDGPIPNDFNIIDLPACSQLVFQGPPFDDKKFEQAITSLWDVMNQYDPAVIGYAWAPCDGPRFQLAPMGYRGYIEGKPVRKINFTSEASGSISI